MTYLEERGVPTTFVASTEFVQAAETQSSALGHEHFGVFVAHPIQDRTDDEIRELAEAAIDDLVSALESR